MPKRRPPLQSKNDENRQQIILEAVTKLEKPTPKKIIPAEPKMPEIQTEIRKTDRLHPVEPHADETKSRKIGKITVPAMFQGHTPERLKIPKKSQKMDIDESSDSGKENCENSSKKSTGDNILDYAKKQLRRVNAIEQKQQQTLAKLESKGLQSGQPKAVDYTVCYSFEEILSTLTEEDLATADEDFERIFNSYYPQGIIPSEIDDEFDRL